MNYWLFMFRPDTYEKVKEHQTIGVRENKRLRFQQVKKGDRFAMYVSRTKLLDGYGKVTSDVFEDDAMIFADDQLYPLRCKVEFNKTGIAKPVADTLWGLSPFEKIGATTPPNIIMCRGGFIELTKDDFDWLVEKICT